MDYDWANEYKVCYNVESYFFRYDNYMKYKETGNEHIKKSTFGVKHDFDIQKEIDKWFDACIGAYCEIDIPLCWTLEYSLGLDPRISGVQFPPVVQMGV